MQEATYEAVAGAVAKLGLIARGGFHPTEGDRVPPVFGSQKVATLIMIGNAGSDLWAHFGATMSTSDRPNPLDEWVADHIGALATDLGAVALFPFGGPPFLPFVSWAQRCEPVTPSAIGILIHPVYGLWHAYRAALVFPAQLDLPPVQNTPRPCDTCADKPCRSTCPVGAFTDAGYDIASCFAHLANPQGADCCEAGCRARRACPVGADYTYPPDHAQFHMNAFFAGGGGTAGS